MDSASRPLLALTVGDPAGVGPEIVRACLADASVRARARLVVLGPEALRDASIEALPAARGEGADVGIDAAREALRAAQGDLLWLPTPASEAWETGRAQASSGRAALAALRAGHELALSGDVDALVTAPVSKEAFRAAGVVAEGQTQLLGEWCGDVVVDMLAIADRLRVSLLTRHLPLRAALDAIRDGGEDEVVRHLARLARGLALLGIDAPRLALAGLNPHAGEAGLLGTEERDFLAPAVARARAAGLDVAGPESPDTVFLKASQGRYDAVLALYHDQGFIPVKLAAPMRAVTVLLGLPYLRVSPAHGTAFDIAGRGVADPTNLRVALERASDWARARTHARTQSGARSASSSRA